MKFWVPGEEVAGVVIMTGAFYTKPSRKMDYARYDVQYACGCRATINHDVLRRRKNGKSPHGKCGVCASKDSPMTGKYKKGRRLKWEGLAWQPTPTGLMPGYIEGDK